MILGTAALVMAFLVCYRPAILAIRHGGVADLYKQMYMDDLDEMRSRRAMGTVPVTRVSRQALHDATPRPSSGSHGHEPPTALGGSQSMACSGPGEEASVSEQAVEMQRSLDPDDLACTLLRVSGQAGADPAHRLAPNTSSDGVAPARLSDTGRERLITAMVLFLAGSGPYSGGHAAVSTPDAGEGQRAVLALAPLIGAMAQVVEGAEAGGTIGAEGGCAAKRGSSPPHPTHPLLRLQGPTLLDLARVAAAAASCCGGGGDSARASVAGEPPLSDERQQHQQQREQLDQQQHLLSSLAASGEALLAHVVAEAARRQRSQGGSAAAKVPVVGSGARGGSGWAHARSRLGSGDGGGDTVRGALVDDISVRDDVILEVDVAQLACIVLGAYDDSWHVAALHHRLHGAPPAWPALGPVGSHANGGGGGGVTTVPSPQKQRQRPTQTTPSSPHGIPHVLASALALVADAAATRPRPSVCDGVVSPPHPSPPPRPLLSSLAPDELAALVRALGTLGHLDDQGGGDSVGGGGGNSVDGHDGVYGGEESSLFGDHAGDVGDWTAADVSSETAIFPHDLEGFLMEAGVASALDNMVAVEVRPFSLQQLVMLAHAVARGESASHLATWRHDGTNRQDSAGTLPAAVVDGELSDGSLQQQEEQRPGRGLFAALQVAVARQGLRALAPWQLVLLADAHARFRHACRPVFAALEEELMGGGRVLVAPLVARVLLRCLGPTINRRSWEGGMGACCEAVVPCPWGSHPGTDNGTAAHRGDAPPVSLDGGSSMGRSANGRSVGQSKGRRPSGGNSRQGEDARLGAVRGEGAEEPVVAGTSVDAPACAPFHLWQMAAADAVDLAWSFALVRIGGPSMLDALLLRLLSHQPAPPMPASWSKAYRRVVLAAGEGREGDRVSAGLQGGEGRGAPQGGEGNMPPLLALSRRDLRRVGALVVLGMAPGSPARATWPAHAVMQALQVAALRDGTSSLAPQWTQMHCEFASIIQRLHVRHVMRQPVFHGALWVDFAVEGGGGIAIDVLHEGAYVGPADAARRQLSPEVLLEHRALQQEGWRVAPVHARDWERLGGDEELQRTFIRKLLMAHGWEPLLIGENWN
eukprot:jgi/Mesvir1/2051/Mv02313-RA.1